MSRAININATQEHIVRACAKRNVHITAIETLVSGGTRVVTSTASGCAEVAKFYGSKVMVGKVERTPLRPARY